jgi:4-hydroxy-tetrahydrodipicolinate synthase
MNSALKKFVPVMVTPFNLKAKVDYEVLPQLIDFYLQAGVRGLFANCLSSEMYSISEDERLELTAFVVKYTNGRVPVVATGSFGLTIEDKAEFTKKIYDTGIAAAIMITGHFARVDGSDDQLLANFSRLFDLTGSIPLGSYECPAPYKRLLTVPVFQQLLIANRLVYHKDTSLLQQLVFQKIAAAANSSLEFYDAHTPNALASLQAGAAGLSAIAGNFYPEIMVWLCNHAQDAHEAANVEWLQAELTAVDPLIHEAYPMSAKYFLQKRGLPVRTISRSYALELTPAQKQALDALYIRFQHWCVRLGINVL